MCPRWRNSKSHLKLMTGGKVQNAWAGLEGACGVQKAGRGSGDRPWRVEGGEVGLKDRHWEMSQGSWHGVPGRPGDGVRQAKGPLKDRDSRWVGDWVEGVVVKMAWDVSRVVWHLEQASDEGQGG